MAIWVYVCVWRVSTYLVVQWPIHSTAPVSTRQVYSSICIHIVTSSFKRINVHLSVSIPPPYGPIHNCTVWLIDTPTDYDWIDMTTVQLFEWCTQSKKNLWMQSTVSVRKPGTSLVMYRNVILKLALRDKNKHNLSVISPSAYGQCGAMQTPKWQIHGSGISLITSHIAQISFNSNHH